MQTVPNSNLRRGVAAWWKFLLIFPAFIVPVNHILLSFTNINVKFDIKIEIPECSHKFNVLFHFRSDVVLYEVCVSSGISASWLRMSAVLKPTAMFTTLQWNALGPGFRLDLNGSEWVCEKWLKLWYIHMNVKSVQQFQHNSSHECVIFWICSKFCTKQSEFVLLERNNSTTFM